MGVFVVKSMIPVQKCIVYWYWPGTVEWATWTNALQNRFYINLHVYTMDTYVLYSFEITQQSNPPILQFSRLYKEFTIQCLQVNVPMHYFFLFLISHIYRQYTAVSGQCEQYWCHWSSTDIWEHYLAIYIIPWVYKQVL